MYKEFLKTGDRFETSKGLLTVEQLLQLPATQTTISFLDNIAVALDDQYENSKGKSFVIKRTKKDKSIKLKLDIVLDILGDVVSEFEANQEAISNKPELQELLAINLDLVKVELKEYSDLLLELNEMLE
jgi:hypothetical protein